MIPRVFDLQIKKYMRIFPAVGIIGPRQCGKTTMAKLIRKELGDKAAYYDLEDPVDNAKFDNASFLLSNLKAKTIIIDEVQRRPELFAILRSVIDKNRRNGRFLLLGSASPEMVRGSSESLAGRIGFIDATPFQLTELPDTIEAMNKHWLRGGFPGAWLARNSSDAHAWMNSFTRTFIERDLNSLFGTTFTPSVMFRLWRMIAHHHAQVWNAASFAKGLDVSAMTVNRYVDHLSGAFMVRKLQPWYENNKKRLTKAPKIYIRDSGVLHHLLGIHDMNTLLNHPVVGHSWEGYVVEQICNALPPSVFPHYYRTHDGAEMDLVLVKGIRPVACVEVKFNTAPVVTRGMAQSITDLRPKKSFIVTPGDVHSWSVRKGITVCGLRPFLEKELPGLIK